MILILAAPLDPHADHVTRKLQERGATYMRFDHADFPVQAELSLAYATTGQAQYKLHVAGEPVVVNRLQAVWNRQPGAPVPHAEITGGLRHSIAEECQTFLGDMWNFLECLWVPACPAVMRQAQLKASQLKVAGALGFELPPTLFTNSPQDFLEFYRQHNGHIVSKVAGRSFRSVDTAFCRYTEVVSKRDVGYAHAVRYCPVIFQAYVPKRVELRITVVAHQVFATEIHSQASNHTRHDWRHYDDYQTTYMPHDLPGDLQQRCVQLIERLGLCYGAIDMVLTPDGRYVFLEINPNGQYLWIEYATGLPISDAICDLLISGSPVNKSAEHVFESHPGGL